MKKLILIPALLFLSACGFTPMHAPATGTNGAAFKNIQVDLLEDPDLANDEGAFWVQQALFDRLGTDGRKHVLTITPKFQRGGFGINARDVATRYDMTATVSYVLTDAKTGDVLDKGTVSSVSTFGAPLDPYGRAVAEQSTTKNVAKNVADRLLTRLAAYYANTDK